MDSDVSGAPERRPYAIVIGMQSMNGLQTARILWRRGIPVIGIGIAGHPYCRTRACERVIPIESADSDVIGLLEAMGPQLEERAILIPCIDQMVSQISAQRDRLEPWYHVVLPPHSTVETLIDKARFTEHAQQHDLPIPPTIVIRSRADAERAASTLSFPCVLKPAQKGGEWLSHTLTRGFKLREPKELLETYGRVGLWTDRFIAQEWIRGGDHNLFTCNAYFDAAGQPVATFVSQKLRQWPPVTGMGSLGVERANEAVLETTVRLFTSVRFHGLAYLEMKRDERTGQYLMIEPNIGRPTGRSALAEACGVELLTAMYRDKVGLPPPRHLSQRNTGIKWMHLRYDLQAAWHEWSHGSLTLRQWWRSIRGRKIYADFSWRDPAPFWLDVVRVARLLLSATARRRYLSERIR